MSTQYLVTTRVKETARNLDMRISQQAIIDVNDRVADLLKRAAHRAKQNRRKTIMPQDL